MTTAVEQVKAKVGAVKPHQTIEDMIRKSTEQLKMALPEHMKAERIVRIALTSLRLNPKLYDCDPKSFLAALFQSASLGLEPNLNGEAWLIPYNTKKGMVVQFQIGAYGLLKLFWNHQNAVSLQVEKVHTNDAFEYDLGACTVKHQPPVFGKERGEVIGYYASARLSNGGHLLKVLSKEDAVIFAKKHSKCWDKKEEKFMDFTPWRDHFDAMAMKTVLKQLMKLLPKSIEIQRALSLDETVKTKIDVDMSAIPDETEYKEIVDGAEEGKVEPEAQLEQSKDPVAGLPENFGVKRTNAFLEEIEKSTKISDIHAVAKSISSALTNADITEAQMNTLEAKMQDKQKEISQAKK